MAKMTVAGLQSFVKTYVAAAKQAGAWSATTDNFLGLLDKVGKQITIDGNFEDKLPELNGDDLPLGKTIEEWFVDLTLPATFDNTGANTLAPADPAVEDPAYSYTLGRRTIKTTQRYDNIERAAINENEAGNMIAKIMERLADSYSLYTYAQKKQLIGNAIDKAVTAGRVETVAKPVDTTTGEAFIKQLKNDVEEASFATENTSISGCLIGAAPELVLYVKKGVMASLDVDTFAGAFNKEDLAIPAKIKVVEDFGDLTNDDVYAVLVDPRGIKLHRGYHAIRSQENAEGDFMNFVDHSENTGFISKFSYIKAYKAQ